MRVSSGTDASGDIVDLVNYIVKPLGGPPPVVATWSDFFGASTTIPSLHDPLGRRYTLGVEVEF